MRHRVRRTLRLCHPGGCSFGHKLTGFTVDTQVSERGCGVSDVDAGGGGSVVGGPM